MTKVTFLLSLVLCLFIVISSCAEDEEPVVVDCTTVTYSATIRAIVANSCSDSNCHGTNATNGDFSSYDKIMDVATNDKMRTQVVDQKTMPKGGSLTAEQIAQVKCWLDAGAPDN